MSGHTTIKTRRRLLVERSVNEAGVETEVVTEYVVPGVTNSTVFVSLMVYLRASVVFV